MVVNHFRFINLIFIKYKILAKVLTTHLAKVIDNLVTDEHMMFINGWKILDGPFFMNEVVELYKKKNRKWMLFEIEFSKAYDSVR